MDNAERERLRELVADLAEFALYVAQHQCPRCMGTTEKTCVIGSMCSFCTRREDAEEVWQRAKKEILG